MSLSCSRGQSVQPAGKGQAPWGNQYMFMELAGKVILDEWRQGGRRGRHVVFHLSSLLKSAGLLGNFLPLFLCLCFSKYIGVVFPNNGNSFIGRVNGRAFKLREK